MSNKSKKRVAVVTGGSSGIGLAVVNRLTAHGWTVCALSRRACPNAAARSITADVNQEADLRRCFEQIVDEYGQIDALVCCAGNGIAGAVEDSTEDDARYQFETVFFGLDKTVRACIPHMRRQKFGHILTVSSVAAVVPIPFQTYYSAAKAAVVTYTKALSMELKPFGIRCTSVLPGDTKTGFTSARRFTAASLQDSSPYYADMKASVGRMERDEANGLSPDLMARAVERQLCRRHPTPTVVPHWDYKLFALLVRILPNRLVLWVVDLLY